MTNLEVRKGRDISARIICLIRDQANQNILWEPLRTCWEPRSLSQLSRWVKSISLLSTLLNWIVSLDVSRKNLITSYWEVSANVYICICTHTIGMILIYHGVYKYERSLYHSDSFHSLLWARFPYRCSLTEAPIFDSLLLLK